MAPAAQEPFEQGHARDRDEHERDERVPHHTRLPGYAHGKVGTVERVHGVHVFADTNAHDQGEQPQWLYGVVFDGTELWGADAAPGLQVALDAWEPTLSPA